MREEGERAERCVAYRVRRWKPLRRWLRLQTSVSAAPPGGAIGSMESRMLCTEVTEACAAMPCIALVYGPSAGRGTAAPRWSIVRGRVDRGDARHVSPRGLSRE